MPDFLKNPTHSKVIRQVRSPGPVQHPLILPLLSHPNPLATHSKLSTTNIADMGWDVSIFYIKELLVRLRKRSTDIGSIDICLRGRRRVNADRASRF